MCIQGEWVFTIDKRDAEHPRQCKRYTGNHVKIMSIRTFSYTLPQAVAIV
ncbi:hypothetical protein WP5S18E01_33980 [Enterobacter cloacae]|nr:hypothetical protein WP5S18E01_33980 [Enterobacter cloacae]